MSDLDAALQEQGVEGQPGALLTGWALVTQWMDPEGNQWVARDHSDSLPRWAAKGLWHEALFGDWADEDDE